MFSFANAHREPSKTSVPGAQALLLDDGVEAGPSESFLTDREFCHIHPPDDGSLHMALPTPVAEEAKNAGWAEPHPLAERGLIPETAIMVYAPCDDEITTVLTRVDAAYPFAGGGATGSSIPVSGA